MKYYLTYIKTSNGVAKSEPFATEALADARAAILLNTDDTLEIFLSSPSIKYVVTKFVKSPF